MSRRGVRSIIWGGRFILGLESLRRMADRKKKDKRPGEGRDKRSDMRNICYLHPTAKSNVISVVAAVCGGDLFKRPTVSNFSDSINNCLSDMI
jgi:hypothetical protein